MIDADLSARAQGLLLRWLRRPPGAEIDDIGEMVKRSKREGKKRLEGRDALYKASYELEEEGFLVREQERGRSGQYEWVVRIYSSPVHPDKRSNPEDRKRAPRVRAPQKPRSAPLPEKPELVDQESADQESADQELSFKNSVNDSLSGLSRPSGDGSVPGGEREAAAPEPAGADVVVDAYERAAGRRLARSMRVRLASQATELLAAGDTVEWLAERAAEMPGNGWRDLVQHCEANRRRPVPAQAGPGLGGAPGGERRATPEQVEALRARLAGRGSGL